MVARRLSTTRCQARWVVGIGLLVILPACLSQQLAEACHHCGFYIPHQQSVWFQLASKAGTDKVTQTMDSGSKGHAYEGLYTKYFEGNRRHIVNRVLEIGLGCTMAYGPGASSKLWRWYFPQATIWQAEYSAECVAAHKEKLEELGVKVVTGDQADTNTLHRWVRETGGRFDVIIDDGGHTSMQQYNSFVVLFIHALKPGGVYFIEDLATGRSFVDGDKKHIMQDVIKDWIEALTLERGVDYANKEYQYVPRFRLPPGVKFIDCAAGICAITKCYRDDTRCALNPGVDHNLTHYTATGTNTMNAGK